MNGSERLRPGVGGEGGRTGRGRGWPSREQLEAGMKVKVRVKSADGTGFQKGNGPGGEVGSEDKWSGAQEQGGSKRGGSSRRGGETERIPLLGARGEREGGKRNGA